MRLLIPAFLLSVIAIALAAPTNTQKIKSIRDTLSINERRNKGSFLKRRIAHPSSWSTQISIDKENKPPIKVPIFAHFKHTSKLQERVSAADLHHVAHLKATSPVNKVSRSSTPSISVRQGLTGDRCNSTSECIDDRICADNFSSVTRCEFEGGDALPCETTDECPLGEICVSDADVEGGSLCLSQAYVEEFQPESTPSASNGGGSKLTFEGCNQDRECAGNRFCREGSTRAFCIPEDGVQPCFAGTDCVSGEICLTVSEDSICISPIAISGNSKGSDGGGSKLTFDNCTSDDECAGNRFCFESSLTNVVCVPRDGLQFCDADFDCVTGETCRPLTDEASRCISANTGSAGNEPSEGNEDSTDTSKSESDGGGSKLTFEDCTSDDECAGNRLCESSSTTDFCVPRNGLQSCDGDNDCVTRETCRRFTEEDSRCVSAKIGSAGNEPSEGNGGTTDSSGSDAGGSKLTFEDCASDDECAGNRFCFESSSKDDVCVPRGGLQSCDGDNDCVTGETCRTLTNGDSVCALARAETAADEPCISIHFLKHLPSQALVFATERLANVLCDENESCATPGHMITYHGKGMMMKSYCELIGGCVKKVMPVNSPRYRKGLTVPSSSENMVFTAFSARYVTRAEESVLSGVIRLGF